MRQDNVGSIADGIRSRFLLRPDMRLMDFGAGTGLLLQRLAPHVGHITAVDVSPAMLSQLEAKRGEIDCTLDLVEADLTKTLLEHQFDGIISSMTFHHIDDVMGLLQRLRPMLNDGGFIAVADLETEDGSFHENLDEGIFHFGFEPEVFWQWAEVAGYRGVQVQRVSVIKKPHGDYPVFLLTAQV